MLSNILAAGAFSKQNRHHCPHRVYFLCRNKTKGALFKDIYLCFHKYLLGKNFKPGSRLN